MGAHRVVVGTWEMSDFFSLFCAICQIEKKKEKKSKGRVPAYMDLPYPDKFINYFYFKKKIKIKIKNKKKK